MKQQELYPQKKTTTSIPPSGGIGGRAGHEDFHGIPFFLGIDRSIDR
jgi:hypothetical protein